MCILFLSSHLLAALIFDSNNFGLLLWKLVKLRGQNEIKPQIGKTFRKYKPIRYYFPDIPIRTCHVHL